MTRSEPVLLRQYEPPYMYGGPKHPVGRRFSLLCIVTDEQSGPLSPPECQPD